MVAVLVSLALMLADHRQQHLESVRSVLSAVTYPLYFIANLPWTGSRWLGDTFATRSRLQQENRALRKENLLLQTRQQKLASLEAENVRMRELLDSSFRVGERVLIAELVAVDLDPYRQQVLVNKGSSSGVYRGQPVLDANSVMGQVTHINRFSATVLLITDARHALPVQVNRNGLRTVAMGSGRINELELPHLPNNADIIPGDLLVTSGLGGVFPPGYPVAEVISVVREPGQSFATVKARPQAHLDRAREALLVWTLPTLEQFELTDPDDNAKPTEQAPARDLQPAPERERQQ